MNQAKSKTLRRIFASIRPFEVSDPRNRTQLRLLKKRYSKIPKPQRAGFLSEMKAHIAALKQVQEEQANAALRAAEQAESIPVENAQPV